MKHNSIALKYWNLIVHSRVYLMYIVLVYRYKIYNNLDEREELPYQPGSYAHNLSKFQNQHVSVSACSIIYQTTICHTPCTIGLTLCFNLGLINISNFMIRHRGHVGFNVSQNLVVKFMGVSLKTHNIKSALIFPIRTLIMTVTIVIVWHLPMVRTTI